MWDKVQSLLLEKFEVAEPFAGLDVYRKCWEQKLKFFQSKGMFMDGLTISTTTKDALNYDTYKTMIINTLATTTPAWAKMATKLPGSVNRSDLCSYLRRIFLDWITIEEVQNNKLTRKMEDLPKGSKTSKFVTSKIHEYLCKRVTDDVLAETVDAVNQLVSLIFANAKLSDSEVVLSIDPIDILLGSMGTTGWTSCYDWSSSSGGAHGTAPFKLVTDPHTAVAYMKARSTTSVYGLEMQAKKNRAWVFFNSKYPAAVVGRVFPNDNTAFGQATEALCKQAISTMYPGVEMSTHKELSAQGLTVSIALPKPKVNWLYMDPWTNLILDKNILLVADAVNGYKNTTKLCIMPPDFDAQFMSTADMIAWCPKCGSLRADYGSKNLVVCPNCYKDLKDERKKLHDIVDCAYCGNEIRRETTTHVKDFGTVCPTCIARHYDTCSHCNELVPKENLFFHEGKNYCNGCLDKVGLYRCYGCGQVEQIASLQVDHEGKSITLCHSCMSRKYVSCEVCGAWVTKGQAISAGKHYICPKAECRSTIKICRRCGKATAEDIKVLHRNGVDGLWCPDCQDRVTKSIPDYKQCETCGTWVHQDREGECCGQEG